LIGRYCVTTVVIVATLLPAQGVSQATPPPGIAFGAGLQPGGQQLFALDLTGTPLGEFPTSLHQLKGRMEVVLKDGVPMLKATAASEFLITLPRVLPADFTLEFELIPKGCCPPPDLSFEGTPTINQGNASAHVLWQADAMLAVVGGGGENYEMAMPEDLRTTLPGVLTAVVAVIQGPTLRLYTNGRRLYTLDKQFARGRVLRVALGGEDDQANAVYLAALRIRAGAAAPTVVAANPTPPPGQPSPGPVPGAPPTPPPGQPASPPALPPATPPAGGVTGGSPVGGPGKTPSVAKSSDKPGPSGLTAAPLAGWDVQLQWAELASAVAYELERASTGQGFALLKRIEAPTTTAYGVWPTFISYYNGTYGFVDVTVQPGIAYEYRVRADFADGTASGYSPVASFTAPTQVPQIRNLVGVIGPTAIVHPDRPDKVYRPLTWTWDMVQAQSYQTGIEAFVVDPVTGSPTSRAIARQTQSGLTPTRTSEVETGMSYRFCVSVLTSEAWPLPQAACTVTEVASLNTLPAQPPAPTPSDPTLPPTHNTLVTKASLCAPAKTSAGPGPASITVPPNPYPSPVGAALTWPDVSGAVAYVVERGNTASGTQAVIASTCGSPGFSLGPTITFLDRTGGIASRTSYTYVVHAYGSNGQTGWNSVKWISPSRPTVFVYPPQVNGSTVAFHWDVRLVDPATGKPITGPQEFLITSSYGFSQLLAGGCSSDPGGCRVTVLGVPIGSHTFTVTARWRPDVSVMGTASATVTP